jgi:hypothetical protein
MVGFVAAAQYDTTVGMDQEFGLLLSITFNGAPKESCAAKLVGDVV